MPRTVECELTDDLVDTCGPGDNVTVIGIVKVCISILHYLFNYDYKCQ